MNRRAFLGRMVGGLAAAAAVCTFPFRVFSFPTTIDVYKYDDFLTASQLADETVIDPIVQQCALELSYRAGRSLDELVKQALA